ncbi:phosphatase PAP2 family protein [Polaromonas sp.]|uniref:phosphatase PAP2 family protein n=1 Tax=Polaromonas sp. TaxID=1869339 RepID=UPI0024889958|nr:phosphatase PAP2 family protein [Polaromonas sp.]MDI1338562.1 phosphatase PAP2 family protein [Polaromonas sp.]
MTSPSRPAVSSPSRLFFWSVASLLLLLTWDASGLDLTLARWFGSASGFALENHWFWRGVLHDNMRPLPWLFEGALLIGIARPVGPLRHLPASRRVQLALTTLLALLVVADIKLHSHTSCPWSLHEFGGVASHVSHWDWGVRDGGDGGCFPAGHASAGFAFVGGFFAFRHALPATARRWLLGSMLAGLLLGLAQQVRGAHYMSHTLWTAWFCWASAATLDLGFTWLARLTSQKPRPVQAQAPGL